ncbi:hypothetical protein F5879DRAFT_995896 [Lentinula edodes]|nr:hypothetical protein F5879DRAFT_995896 [Lentinula edodes]
MGHIGLRQHIPLKMVNRSTAETMQRKMMTCQGTQDSHSVIDFHTSSQIQNRVAKPGSYARKIIKTFQISLGSTFRVKMIQHHMLLLLKPWQNIVNDLKRPTETWEEVFKEFVETCPKRNIDIMSGIQYYYECESAALKEQENNFDKETVEELGRKRLTEKEDFENNFDEEVPSPDYQYTEEGLALLLKASSKSYREELHGAQAVELAKQAKILESPNQNE